MGKQNEELLVRLKLMDDLLSKANDIASFDAAALDSRRSYLTSLRQQCQSNWDFLPDILKRIDQQVAITEKFIVSWINRELSRTAKKHGIDWTLAIDASSLELAETTPLLLITPLLESFAEKAAERNKLYQDELNKLQKKLAKKRASSPVLAAIQKQLDALATNPTTLLPVETIITLRRQCIQKKPCLVEIQDPEPGLSPENVALQKDIVRLTAVFQQLAKESRSIPDLPAFEEWVKTDFNLQQWALSFDELTAQSIELIQRQENHLENDIILPAYLLSQHAELQMTVNQLTKWNHTRRALLLDTSERKLLIAPETEDCKELQAHSTKVIRTFRTALEEFLLAFSVIELTDKEDTDNVYFRKKLEEFIWILDTDLKNTHLKLDSRSIDTLHEYLAQHLGIRTHWYTFRATTRLLKEVDFFTLSDELFANATQGPDTAAIAYKKQIAAIHHTMAKLKAFPLKQIKHHHSLKVAESQTHTEIINQHKQLNAFLEGLLNVLREKLILFSSEDQTLDLIITTRVLRQKLQDSSVMLSATLVDYQYEQNKLKEGIDPLEQLNCTTLLQQETLTKFRELNNTSLILEKEAKLCLDGLKEKYKQRWQQFDYQQQEALANTRAALAIRHHQPEIDEILVHPQGRIEAFNASGIESLFNLHQSTTVTLAHLEELVDTLKDEVQKATLPQLQKQTGQIENYPDPKLQANNPFTKALEDNAKRAKEGVLATDAHFKQLEKTATALLPDWHRIILKKIEQSQIQLDIRNQTIADALEIERRLLKNKTYTTSLSIIARLRAEFERVITSRIDRAIAYANEADKPDLKNVKDLPLQDITDARVLNLIDPRLIKLYTMRMEFESINDKYINTNLDLYKDDAKYLHDLTTTVITHLHHNNMETISDGRRLHFVQWIRINILKPLQSLQQHVSNYLNQDPTAKHRFFTTIGATRTEKELVQTGNEVFVSLTAPAA